MPVPKKGFDGMIEKINKYGWRVKIPDRTRTVEVRMIEEILIDLDICFVSEWKIGRKPFDIAVFDPYDLDSDLPKLLIEFDGPMHHRADAWGKANAGCRAGTEKRHLFERQIGDAKKDRAAFEKGIPVLRVRDEDIDEFRDKFLAYYAVFVTKEIGEGSNHIAAMDILDRYGYDFVFLPKDDDLTKAETARIERWIADHEQGVT